MQALSTPTMGILVREYRAVGGIQISASHNPPSYNGIKLFNESGRVLPAGDGKLVLDAYKSELSSFPPWDELKTATIISDPVAAHLKLVLGIVDEARIRAKAFRVLLDSNHGAGSILGRELLTNLSCQVQILGGEPDGKFEHPPEPLPENLAEVSRHFDSDKFDVGFCQDPDADRLAILDEHGKYIGEECTVALCLKQILTERSGPIVTNCATSWMTKILAEKHQATWLESRVGEANVVDRMLESGAIFGGEGNGGPIDPRVGLVRDSFVGMALVLNLMASTGQSVSQLVGSLPPRFMMKSKLNMTAKEMESKMRLLESHFKDAKVDRLDGARFLWNDRWLLLRASNTEPLVRLIAEAPTESEARDMVDSASKAME